MKKGVAFIAINSNDAENFRELVLNQRDRMTVTPSRTNAEPQDVKSSESSAMLAEIRDTLLRIESNLKRSE